MSQTRELAVKIIDFYSPWEDILFGFAQGFILGPTPFQRFSLRFIFPDQRKSILRVVYRDFDSLFEKLQRKDNCTTLHQQNLKKPVTEIFKIKVGIDLELTKYVFKFANAP